MNLKIAVGLMKHESNSFNPKATEINDFRFGQGKEILNNKELLKGSSLAGMIEVFADKNVDIIPLASARAINEGGIVSKETYQIIKTAFLEEIKAIDDLDGICLDLHGSMTVEGIGDAEGDLLSSLRKIVGDKVPIVTALDLHAMITKKMLESADAFVAYRTAPHVDVVTTGKKAANLLYDALTEGYRLKMEAVSIPMLVSGEKSETEKEPMLSLINQLNKTDNLSDVLFSSYLLGFPWADVDYNHGAALVVTKEDASLAEQEAIRLANEFWKRHKDFKFTTEAYRFSQSLELAAQESEGPVFICEVGDNPGAGGSQNITYSLQKMIENDLDNALLGVVADKKAYQTCKKSNINDVVELDLGRCSIEDDAPPLRIKGVLNYCGNVDGIAVAIVKIKGIDVVITTERVTMTKADFFTKIKLNLTNYKVVVLKGGYLDPEFKPYAKRVIFGLAPGYTAQIFTDLTYDSLQHPIYPLDKEFVYSPEEYLLSND